MASAGLYVSLHLAPDRQPHQHPTTQFLQAGCPSSHPTNNVKVLKAFLGNKNVRINFSYVANLNCTGWLKMKTPAKNLIFIAGQVHNIFFNFDAVSWAAGRASGL